MGTEIERKFLVEDDDWDANEETSADEIDQGYFGPDVEIRVRRYGDHHVVTWKAGKGRSRTEVEIPVDAETFDQLWELTAGSRLQKVRHRVPISGGLVAELDRYRGRLEGLSVVEVEFDSDEASRAFTPPPGFGAEVTDDERFANAKLAVADSPPAAPAG
ncbi:CYTH domain-containing protein [Rhabdothermincola salaria]|uniref:CYTH domain-containing protein n=1 Tax=Rhabdothermincola salaria TaxID=2903142 RepID=UPI001E5ECBE9|nr:CYTH domain-containing protein [Rhabdothermincola salaria]MCD9624524.1 CYTH domain-containing protein [Rhabdothermincola salaria]